MERARRTSYITIRVCLKLLSKWFTTISGIILRILFRKILGISFLTYISAIKYLGNFLGNIWNETSNIGNEFLDIGRYSISFNTEFLSVSSGFNTWCCDSFCVSSRRASLTLSCGGHKCSLVYKFVIMHYTIFRIIVRWSILQLYGGKPGFW